ncbi:MAG: hypothetical protein AAGK74_12445 [Chloroflexota bacterium]
MLFLLLLFNASNSQAQQFPTLADFWEGRAEWVVDVYDVGLPVGESDTILRSDGELWSYLHASDRSAGIVDQCGQPVAFPGCTTLWRSTDGGTSFDITAPVCLMPCGSCPCTDDRDHITAQQYPRVAVVPDAAGNIETAYMTYEWHAQTRFRTSPDGVNWSPGLAIRFPGGTFPSSFSPCSATETIGPHPNIEGQADDCLVGAPPGIYIEGETVYVFVAAGSAPGNMRCYYGERRAVEADPLNFQLCEHDPLFSGAQEYGDPEIFGAAANEFFDFRYVSSAEVLKVGDRYYMAYEGIRGPDVLNRGWDTQFALGFARSVSNDIDGPWEKWEGNPALFPLSPNFGVGHADILVIEGETVMYTATSMSTRGRYVLRWR